MRFFICRYVTFLLVRYIIHVVTDIQHHVLGFVFHLLDFVIHLFVSMVYWHTFTMFTCFVGSF